jgi:hypothetical protein
MQHPAHGADGGTQEQTRMTKAVLRESQVFDMDDVLFSMMRRR